MIAPLFGDRCVLCGRPVWRDGERFCIRHDFEFCIAEGYRRAMERLKNGKEKPARGPEAPEKQPEVT